MRYYLDRNQIERLASNKDVYTRGMHCYTEGRVSDLEFHQEDGKTRVLASVPANAPGISSEIVTTVIFDGTGILQKFSCSCDAFGVWRGGCEHVIAVFLKIYDYNKESALISRSVRASRSLLEALEKQVMSEIDKSLGETVIPVNPVSLLPAFGRDHISGFPGVSLEIGINRMYVVKSIDKLLEAIQKELVIKYGKNLELKHSLSLFDRKSRIFAEFLMAEYVQIERTRTILHGQYCYYGRSFNDRLLPLAPSGLDGFFDIFNGDTIGANFTNELKTTRKLRLTDAPPDAHLNLRQTDTGNLTLSWEGEGDIMMLRGERYGYFIYNGIFRRIDLSLYDTMVPVLAALKSVNFSPLGFSGQDKKKLASYLLPALQKHGLLTDSGEADEFLPLSPRAYLDAENGSVICTPAFAYGGVEFRQTPSSDSKPDGSIARDIPGEYALIKTLSLMGFVPGTHPGIYAINSDDAIYDFYYSENGLKKLRELAEVFATEAFSQVSGRPSKTPRFGLRINGSLLEIDVDAGDFTSSELLAVLESHRLKKKYHKLTDGRFVDLQNTGEESVSEPLDALDSLISGLNLTQKDLAGGTISLPKYRALYADAALNENPELRSARIDEGVSRLSEDFRSFKNIEFRLPETLDPVLRTYQKEGFKWLMTLSRYGFGGILADDMGLGKTIQVIAVLLSYKEETPSEKRIPSMVVAPTSLIYNWEKEINRFAPELTTAILSGAAQKRKETFTDLPDADVFITTYDMLKRDIENYTGTSFRYVIADEAQNIKNPGTQNAKAIKMLNAEVRLALTGTPIENALSELWSIFDFAMPGYLLNASRFTKNYETPIIKNGDMSAAARLRKQIAPFIMRRLKSEVLTELPEKVETTLYADMTPEQKKIYAAHLLKAKGELEESVRLGRFKENQIAILSMITRLRQICCHPATFVDNYKGGSGKLDLTVETVKSSLESGHRLLIFSQFTRMLGILMERLDNENIRYFYLDGSTPSKERLEMTDLFNSGERDAFLISLKAGGSGLNLTGADVVIHYDPWWNPAVMSQASDRAHRFGQLRTVQVINIVAKDSIEEKIIALQGLKKDLVDSVIEEGASFITRLSQDEIMELFKQ